MISFFGRAACFAVLFLSFVQSGDAADLLKFFKNYFVTGDFAVAGTGLRGTGVGGWATGTINMTGVPCTLGNQYVTCNTPGAVPADVVAAFLYWQTNETTNSPGSRVGYFDGGKILGKAVGDSAACWSSGGTNPQTFGRIYRADVLRRLTIDPVNNVRLGNGPHTVKLSDSGGNGNGDVPLTNGASLVVVYRVLVAGNPMAVPYRSIVFYDGGFSIPKDSAGMTLTTAGFFQAAATPNARMTQIVSNGQPGFLATLRVNGATLDTDPYIGAQGARWDNPTYSFNLAENAASYSTTVTPNTNQTCVVIGAQVTSLNVKDGDFDGILDLWEDKGLHQNDSAATFGTCETHPGDCVNLPAMGADKNARDIFVELDWMHGDDGHLHVPKLAALYKVACAFAAKNIWVHFDVANLYQNEYCLGSTRSFIVPAAHSKGGEVIEESSLRCPLIATADNDCAYDVGYSVLSYKTGFRLVRDGFQLLQSGVPVVNFPRRFERNRKDIFHYGLFAHALAGPFNSQGQPLSTDPASTSGVGDRPGGDFMVTLGRWRSDDLKPGDPGYPCNPASNCADQTGSADVQAGTLAHELGHNLYLSHAGNSRTPNCIPNYPSVMNYNNQVRLLTDAAGNSWVDFSDGLLKPNPIDPLNETALTSAAMGPMKYRVRYYGPPINPHEGRAKAYCNGQTNLGYESVRLESPTVGTPDWDRDGIINETISFDVNYDGPLGAALFNDSNDWVSMNLQQVSARLNSNGVSTGVGALDLGALDLGALDLGALNFYLGALDLGALDLGALDLGALDLGALDLGALDLGALDLGALDLGALDLGALDLGEAAGDVKFSDVNAAPDAVSASQPLKATLGIGAITLTWGAPPIGQVRRYDIHRSDDGTNFILFDSRVGAPPATGYVDTVNDFDDSGTACPNTVGRTCYNKTYTYYVTTWVVSESNGLTESGASNFVNGEVKHAFVIGNNQGSVVYGDPVPLSPTFTVYGSHYGTLSSVTCSYDPSPARNVGSYSISCTGPASTSEVLGGVTYISGVTYNTAYNDGTLHSPGSLTITKRPITVTAAANTKTYDGNTSAAAIPTLTSGSLAYTDAANFSEVYDTRHAGVNKTLTPSGGVNDGNGGNNYIVTFVNNTIGVINRAPLTITALTNTKTYDGNVSAAAAPTVSGLVSGDTVKGLAETYSDPNAATGKTLSVSAYNVNDGNSGGNYIVTLMPNTTGVINKATAIISVIPYNIIGDGTPHTATGTAVGVVGENVSVYLNLSGTTHTAAGDYPNDPWTFSAPNYNDASGAVHDHIVGFVATGSMITARSFHTATRLANGKVLVAGGLDAGGAPLGSSELYDPATGTFSLIGSNMPNKAARHTATLLGNGKVLLIGGGNSSSEIYDPATNSWSSAGGISGQRSFHTATLLGNGKVLFAGGADNSGKALATAFLYDPATGYSSNINMTVGRELHTATLLPNGMVLIAGGRIKSGNSYVYLSSAELYDPTAGSLGSFTAVAGSAMSSTRSGHTAILHNGKVLLAGGANSATLKTADLYDPASGTFTATGSMTTARQYFTAAVALGVVVEIGGLNGARLSSAEQYTGTGFQSAGNMLAARAAHTTTPLANGSVLITGGEGSTGASIRTAELLK